MSDLKATVQETQQGFHVVGYEKIEYDFTFLDGVFDTRNPNLADCYEKWGRCLAVMDRNIFDTYGDQMQGYFDHYKLDLKIHKTMIGEKAKSIETYLSIVDSMNEFGIFRKVSSLAVMVDASWVLTLFQGTGFGGWRRTCHRRCWVIQRHRQR
jgi:3-dehydroquinate synthase